MWFIAHQPNALTSVALRVAKSHLTENKTKKHFKQHGQDRSRPNADHNHKQP